MNSLRATPVLRIDLRRASAHVPVQEKEEQAIMSDFIFVGLGVVLFVVIAGYARLCARL
jgi:hypothetical protein